MKVTYIQHCGDDLAVVNAARVSFKAKSYGVNELIQDGFELLPITVPTEKDIKLIKYLATHKHYSPFNHTFCTMHVKAPLFVARQLVKHEYMPWNEVSRRYVDSDLEFYYPEAWRKRPPGGIKQGSGEDLQLDWDVEPYVMESLRAYDKLLESGVAPEMARMVLPQNMYTEWYWSGTLRAWAKMYNLRAEETAQKETQEIARQVGEILAPLFPHSWEALTCSET
jgi:thymidylate synthase (FAD)